MMRKITYSYLRCRFGESNSSWVQAVTALLKSTQHYPALGMHECVLGGRGGILFWFGLVCLFCSCAHLCLCMQKSWVTLLCSNTDLGGAHKAPPSFTPGMCPFAKPARSGQDAPCHVFFPGEPLQEKSFYSIQ